MGKYAVIKIKDAQLLVGEGDVFDIAHQTAPVKVQVLFYSDNGNYIVGTPEVEGAKVNISVVGEKNSKKIRVARFKSKSRYRKVNGHKQLITTVKVDSITFSEKKASVKAEDAEIKGKDVKPAKEVKSVEKKAVKSEKKEVKAKKEVKKSGKKETAKK